MASQKTRDQHLNKEEALRIIKGIIAENHVEIIEQMIEMYEEEPEKRELRIKEKKKRSEFKKLRNKKNLFD